MSSFFIETYGCQLNTAESNALEQLFLNEGFEKSESGAESDVVVINTCSVRKSAENRIWGRLGSYAPVKKDRKQVLIVTGCMAQRLGEEIKKKSPQVDYVIGTNDKFKIVEIAKTKIYEKSEKYGFVKSYWREGDFASFVPIMNGCNNFCSYCIVPYVRGREISRPVDEIIKEVKYLESKGVKEITLLGQNVNSYRFGDVDFPELLKKICSVCNGIEWVKFESPHPKDFSDELIDVISKEKKVAKHLHIPMQSGSTRILSLMNRRYSRQQYLDLIHKIKKRIPEVTFAVDVMVGFPSETEEDLEQTISAMDDAGYIEAYMYYWNPREGTKAVEMDGQICDEEKQKRLQKVIDHQLEKAAEIKSKRAYGVQKVLATQVSRDNANQMLGRNEHNEMVAFDTLSTVKPGDMVWVEFKGLNGNTYTGRQVKR